MEELGLFATGFLQIKLLTISYKDPEMLVGYVWLVAGNAVGAGSCSSGPVEYFFTC